jgi:hypothetical protein
MRTKLFKIAQAATLGLSLAFTISCSGDGGRDENGGDSGNHFGSNLPDFPKQAYLYVENGNNYTRNKYDVDSDIKIVFKDYENCNYAACNELYPDNVLSVGKIKGGQVSFSLPDNIDSKHSRDFQSFKSFICSDDDKECNISIPENITFFPVQVFYLTIPGRDCNLNSRLVRATDYSKVLFIYFSKSGKITVTKRDGDAYDNFDLNFSKGWSILHSTEDTRGEYEWWIKCND